MPPIQREAFTKEWQIRQCRLICDRKVSNKWKTRYTTAIVCRYGIVAKAVGAMVPGFGVGSGNGPWPSGMSQRREICDCLGVAAGVANEVLGNGP